MKLSHRFFFLLCLAITPRVESAADATKLPLPSDKPVDFVRDIQPIFVARCLSCHGAGKSKGDLRLDLKSFALRGGDSGKVIVPGKSGDSKLIHLVAGVEADSIMPPQGERLSAMQVGLLRRWIDDGASWPDEAQTTRNTHWSLQPLHEPPVPQPKTQNNTNAIDSFILARLEKDGLSISPIADRTTLIRRLKFDLIGLPPTPAEIDSFVKNSSPKAYEELVDRLLASPQYGERWGRHWLDVVRYTESQGFEYDRLRDNAWHYRDYVIKSFNDDKPYDRFIKEQIAGDVLEPVTSESIIAASLLVCGPWDQAGSSQANATQRAITREDEMEDLLGVVGQSFLGLTVNCARCHTHKFDPISHEEYYRVKAVFEGVQHGESPIGERAVLAKEISVAQAVVARIESEGWKLAAAGRPPGQVPAGPAALVRWSFTNAATPNGELKGGAAIINGLLQLPKQGAYFQSAPLTQDIRAKTLEAWVSLDTLEQGGGAAISLESEDGTVFDAIVYGERQTKQWVAGSNGFARTRDLNAPEETATANTFVHVAITYHADGNIAVFRNGELYGQPYRPANGLQTFVAGKSRVVLGLRHTGGGRAWLTGAIKQAALYDRALSAAEIRASFRAAGPTLPQAEVLAALSTEQRAMREEALAKAKRAADTLATLEATQELVSYVGTRVQPALTRRLKRGDVTAPDEVVTPGALSAIADLNPDFGLAADAPEGLRRLKFADWVADARNPLTSRVMANRIWHYHFGQGLVATPNDFGVSGARPSHPELLDYLATKFMENGWSIKALHRLIVNSGTYKQSSAFNAKAAALDADNQLLWRYAPRRLEAEALRDAMLSVSGQLNPQRGGPSFRPFDALGFPANVYVPSDKIGPQFNRRTVYRMNVNSGKEPLLDAFDCPDPSVKTPRRGVTTTPLQALGLMNNSFVQRQAKLLAERAMREADNDLPGAIEIAYGHALGRSATKEETTRATALAQQRGLTSVCWALLNATEFVYVQ
jgi:mono/diheme cytochrome c family protein